MIAENTSGTLKAHRSVADRVFDMVNPMRLGQRAHAFYRNTRRRQGWFMENLGPRKVSNMLSAVAEFSLKRERLSSWPVVVKIDISPLCNLSCTVCVHADPNGNPALEKQNFGSKDRMRVDQYRRIIDEIAGKSTAVSLYYLGDPLVHPDLDEMSRIAYDAGLNVHISTNFSFALNDDRIRQIVRSGLTHLTVCVDGLSQEKYQLTRVGGRIDRVLSNLERVCAYRAKLGQYYPQVEVQFIKFQHNVDELDAARRRFKGLGVDQVTDFWGALDNYTDGDPTNYSVVGPHENTRLPQCFWPYFSMVVKFNGDVIPCCSFRLGEQHTSVDDPRVLGNVFETSVREVWNSMHYQQARRLVASPESVRSEPELEKNFCYACPKLFDTQEKGRSRYRGKNYTFEQLYTVGVNGRPIRRETPVGAGAAS